MFIASLEYRKYIQRPRTPEEKNNKLISLALKAKKLARSNEPYSVFVREIERAFNAGEDILDPDVFLAAFKNQVALLHALRQHGKIRRNQVLRDGIRPDRLHNAGNGFSDLFQIPP